jgi:hypothetical protein
MSEPCIVWFEVCYRDEKGNIATIQGKYTYDDAADLAIRLEKETGKYYWLRGVANESSIV